MADSTLMKNDSIDNHIDDHVEQEIQDCFSAEHPKCFFVFAGAGSGKTRSLINTLTFLDKDCGENLAMNGKQIAVITYTNAACDEISRRLQYKPIFSVSTIHSFLWELIKSYQADIKEWVRQSVKAEIDELEEKQLKGRGGKVGEKRAEDIRRKKERLEKIETVRKFSYNSNGDNVGFDSLSHSEVIRMSTDFIMAEPTMQNIFVTKYPILLIDESQAEILQNAENALESLMELWADNKIPSCLDALRSIRDTGLFEVGSRADDLLAEQYEGENQKIIALRTALLASFSELERYSLYVTDNTRFATHQGVKGLEFPRVMVIMDDAQARGFLFSYEKLFGVKAKTDTDLKNEREGKDTGITRTARLFYVACTRAQSSLAVVAYTEDADSVKDTALSNNWFSENEIAIL